MGSQVITPRRLRGGWHEARSDARYTLARHWPPRFDVCASASFPIVRRGRLARQIRQDLWRQMRQLRGFSPIVEIHFTDCHLTVTAGGRVLGRAPDGMADQIEALLNDPIRRARWIAWARETAPC